MKKSISGVMALCTMLVSCTDNPLNSFDDLNQQNFMENVGTTSNPITRLGYPMCTPQTNEFDNTGNPVGGGPGYNQMINPSQANFTVTTLIDLKIALNNAQAGSIIFLPDTAIIEITDPEDFNLPLKEGVILASNRGGSSCGAIITTSLYGIITQCDTCKYSNWVSDLDFKKGRHIFQVQGNNVRVTGIRFFGPSTEIGNTIQIKGKKCIDSNGYSNLQIDNNEFKGWPFEAISIRNSFKGILIKNNYIHHNIQEGFGYGVTIEGNSFGTCKGNYFEYNRHDIANEGRPMSGYEASYNVVGIGGTSHNFDTHGGCEYGAAGEQSTIAGSFYHIHNNVFYDNGSANIAIRGVPEVMCLIEKNRFIKAPNQNIIRQRQENGACQAVFNENIFVWNNVYNYNSLGTYVGHYVTREWNNKTPSCYIPESFHVDDPVMDFAIGDLNGNGITDLIISKNGSWKKIEYPNEEKFASDFNMANYNWDIIGTSEYLINQVTFADFTGDGITDAFLMDGTNWYLSTGAQGTWQPVNTSGLTKNDVRIGDFDGDSKADIFKANGFKWSISKGGTTGWIDINSSGFILSNLSFGFFDTNNNFDVFKTNQVKWSYSDGGSTGWIDINTSGELLNNLIFADINKDGLTDILVKHYPHHKVSWGGQSGWTDLNYNNSPTILNIW